jgi:hypothetical protein
VSRRWWKLAARVRKHGGRDQAARATKPIGPMISAAGRPRAMTCRRPGALADSL